MDFPSAGNPLFRINQTGYAAGLPVTAAVLSGGPVYITDENGTVLRVLTPEPPQADEASGEHVTLAQAEGLKEGTCRLVCGKEKRKIRVLKKPWQAIGNALIKGFYYQRCGCGLNPRFAGAYAHPACHTAPAAEWEHPGNLHRVSGGWHDAGDYGKYTGPGAVAAAHLLYAWRLFPDGCSGCLDLPESGNGTPDILNEARYELEWLLQMQRADGAFWHKLTKERFAPFIMPQDDRGKEYLMPPSTCAAGAACACLALASRIFRSFDAGFSHRALLSARRAWQWLEEHPENLPFRNPEGVTTGLYGDPKDSDERFWAACELFAATNEAAFREKAESLYLRGQNLTHFGWADVGGMGALCCLFELGKKAGPILHGRLKSDFLKQSEALLALSRSSVYGTALPPDGYVWGSILSVLSGAMALIMNERLTGRRDMLSAALLQWHYALGMNALDTCFVTGFGEKTVLHPHHRPSAADGIDAPVPGLISGGPNKLFPYPSTRERLGADTPPARYWLDETPSADTNEIAVYWNSPAVFTAAYFNMLCSVT